MPDKRVCIPALLRHICRFEEQTYGSRIVLQVAIGTACKAGNTVGAGSGLAVRRTGKGDMLLFYS